MDRKNFFSYLKLFLYHSEGQLLKKGATILIQGMRIVQQTPDNGFNGGVPDRISSLTNLKGFCGDLLIQQLFSRLPEQRLRITDLLRIDVQTKPFDNFSGPHKSRNLLLMVNHQELTGIHMVQLPIHFVLFLPFLHILDPDALTWPLGNPILQI